MSLPTNWKRQTFSNALSVLKDGTHFSPKTFGGKNLYITSKNIRMGKLDLEDVSYIPDEEHQRIYSASPVKYGDVLLTKDGAKTGNVCINTLQEEFSLLSSVAYLRAKTDLLLNAFLLQWLSSPRVQYDIKNDMAGQAITRLTLQKIGKFKILLPPLPEQKAIADLLSTWDEAIEKTERLVQAKERQKLGELHSRISSQKANSTIGAFAKPVVRKVDKPDESYVAVGIRSHFKGTFQRLIEDPRTVNMDSLYRVKENDLILNITFAWEGAIVKKEDEECYVSHRFPTYEIKRSKAEPCFIRQLIMSSRMKYDLSNISPGGAGRNRVLNKKDFLKMPIWLPDLETQKNIGEYLGAIDNEIDLLKQLADKYKTQKRGLMQKMLTGEWRVKPEIVNQYMEA